MDPTPGPDVPSRVRRPSRVIRPGPTRILPRNPRPEGETRLADRPNKDNKTDLTRIDAPSIHPESLDRDPMPTLADPTSPHPEMTHADSGRQRSERTQSLATERTHRRYASRPGPSFTAPPGLSGSLRGSNPAAIESEPFEGSETIPISRAQIEAIRTGAERSHFGNAERSHFGIAERSHSGAAERSHFAGAERSHFLPDVISGRGSTRSRRVVRLAGRQGDGEGRPVSPGSVARSIRPPCSSTML